jgi:hypothetical protein
MRQTINAGNGHDRTRVAILLGQELVAIVNNELSKGTADPRRHMYMRCSVCCDVLLRARLISVWTHEQGTEGIYGRTGRLFTMKKITVEELPTAHDGISASHNESSIGS